MRWKGLLLKHGGVSGSGRGRSGRRGRCPRGRCPRGRCPRGRCPRGRCPRGRCPRGRCSRGVGAAAREGLLGDGIRWRSAASWLVRAGAPGGSGGSPSGELRNLAVGHTRCGVVVPEMKGCAAGDPCCFGRDTCSAIGSAAGGSRAHHHNRCCHSLWHGRLQQLRRWLTGRNPDSGGCSPCVAWWARDLSGGSGGRPSTPQSAVFSRMPCLF
jgi:hypothetical protein